MCYLIEEELKKLLQIPSEFGNFTFLDEQHLQHLLVEQLCKRENLTDNENNTNKIDFDLKVEYRIGDNFVLSCYDSKIKIQFYENKPNHSRNLLYDQIETFFNQFPILNDLKLNDVSNTSWWSVLWSVSKAGKSQMANTSFLSYYQFKYSEVDDFFTKFYNKFVEIPLIGILPIKMDDSVWLTLLNKSN